MVYGSWVSNLPTGFFLAVHNHMDGTAIVT